MGEGKFSPKLEEMSPSHYFRLLAREQGWSETQQIHVLLDYLRDNGRELDFASYARNRSVEARPAPDAEWDRHRRWDERGDGYYRRWEQPSDNHYLNYGRRVQEIRREDPFLGGRRQSYVGPYGDGVGQDER